MGLRRPRIASDRSLSFAMAAGHAHRRRGSFRAFRASPGQRKGPRGSWSGNGETQVAGRFEFRLEREISMGCAKRS